MKALEEKVIWNQDRTYTLQGYHEILRDTPQSVWCLPIQIQYNVRVDNKRHILEVKYMIYVENVSKVYSLESGD